MDGEQRIQKKLEAPARLSELDPDNPQRNLEFMRDLLCRELRRLPFLARLDSLSVTYIWPHHRFEISMTVDCGRPIVLLMKEGRPDLLLESVLAKPLLQIFDEIHFL